MSYIGAQPTTVSFPTDTFNGTGSQTAFTMQLAPASTNSVIVAVSGVVQDPSTYSVSGTTLTFSAAPPAGTGNISVRFLGVPGIPNTPTAGSITNSSFANTLTAIPMQSGTLGAGDSSSMKNRIINGAMVIDQRNAGAAVTASGAYPVDRFVALNDSDGAFSAQQDSSAPNGFINSLKFTTTTADASLGSTQYAAIQHRIEGLNVADLGWGTANAKPVTLSFWVRSSLTGTFGGNISNSATNRGYPFTYTISAANTWEQKSVTIAGDTTGTWLTTNGIGIRVTFGLGAGSTYSGTAGAWAGATYVSATGAVSVIGTLNATWQVTGVQLEVGSTATSFDYRPYGTELALCQRYYETGAGVALSVTVARYQSYYFKVTKRATATITNSVSIVSQGDKITYWYQDSTYPSDTTFTYTASAEL